VFSYFSQVFYQRLTAVKVWGLDIERIAQPHTHAQKPTAAVSANNSVKSLDQLLKNHPFAETSIDNEVEITCLAEDGGTQVSDSNLTDTDLKSIDGKSENDRAAKMNLVFSLNPKPDRKNLTWNYLKKDEIPDGDAQNSFNKNLCRIRR
jgi:hypothetical protein